MQDLVLLFFSPALHVRHHSAGSSKMRLYLALVCLALMGLAQAFMPSGTRLVVRWLTRGRRGNSRGWCMLVQRRARRGA